MRLFLSTFALLGLIAIGGHASSNGDSDITFFGAPRASLDGVLPVLSIEEDYIRGQTDGITNKAFGAAGSRQCSASSPCADGSCCNSQGQCGFRDEHCKNNCIANCDAKAPCGANSKHGSQTCPLNVCCSYFGFCGATDSFCRDTTDSGQSTPCQKQFGKCGTITPPTCGSGSGTASRKIAYYEGWNTRRRPCDRVWPQNIDTTGLTHLIFSFATIDPTTFAVVPMHPDDEKLYADFLGLKDGSQKWIGIGGWEFSDAGATRYTWSQVASSKTNRDAFIASLLQFLGKWDFQGVDIDWEWPGAESRGGNLAIDMRNQIDLMVELRKSLGSCGLSVVLPAQYEYLKNLDPKALEAQVDHFNVLSYDLHGPWDATVPGEGALIKPHTDLKEIDTALNLFWFNDVNPAKINLGIANYGRGYTVADASCARYGCAWTGPSKAGECTQLEGILSQCEIQRIISAKKLNPEIIAGGAAVKQIIFEGQWVGYDDDETLKLKTGLANNRCLGGTALWAIDYASCGGGPGGPGLPQSSAAVPSPSASGVPVVSSNNAPSAPATPSAPAPGTASPAPDVSVNPSSKEPIVPTVSSSPAASSGSSASSATASSTPVVPIGPSNIGSDVPTESSASAPSVSPPMSTAPVSVPTSTSATQTQAESSGMLPTVIPILPSEDTSTSASSIPAPPTLGSSASLSMGSYIASSTAAVTPPLSQTSQAGFSAPATTSSAAQVSSEVSIATSSQAVSSGGPPVVIVPLPGSSQQSQSLQPFSSTSVTTSLVSSPVSSSGPATSQGSSAFYSSSDHSVWTSSVASSTTPVSSESDESQSSSWSTSEETSSAGTSTTSSAVWATSRVLSSVSASASTTGTFSSSIASSTGTDSSAGSSSGQSSAPMSSLAQSSQTSSGTGSPITSWSSSPSRTGTTTLESSQSTGPSFGSSLILPGSSDMATPSISLVPSSSATSSAAGSSGVSSASGQTSTGATTSSPAGASSSTQWSSTTASSAALTSGTQAPSNTITSNPTGTTSGTSATQSGEHTSDDDDETTGVGPIPPVTKPDDKPDPTNGPDPTKPDGDPTTTPGPGTTGKPNLTGTNGGTATPPAETGLPPVTPGLMKGCVPNDCVVDCVSWYALSLVLSKRPFCPCKKITCKPDDEEDDWSDSDDDGENNKCKLLGCGCGFLGLPFGPDCKIDIDINFPDLFPGGIFGPEPCKLFGGCQPPSPPPDNTPPGDGGGDCGPLGCGGYCELPGGCPPCPSLLCNGPLCKIPGGCGPKPGPNPNPPKQRPTGCRKEDEVTVTEKIVHCTENIKLEPTSIVSLNFTLTSTLTSLCVTPVLVTRTGCGLMGTSTTTTHSSFTSTSSSAPMCSRAPLDLNNDEGDNEQPPKTTTDGPSCTRAPLQLDDDEGDNEQPKSSEAPACSRAPLSLDDDEGNNEMPADMSSSLWASFSPTPTVNSSSIALSTSMSMTSSSMDSTSSSISRVPPPSTRSMPETLPPWGTGIPTGTPTPANCGDCKKHFDEIVRWKCKPDGSDVEACAKWSLAALCYESESPDFCKTGPCKHSACPKHNPGDFSKGEPVGPFTTTLTLSSTTIPVTATPVLSTSLSLSVAPTPTCKAGGSISPHDKWTAYVEQEIKGSNEASFAWTLWDENGCEAGKGSATNNKILSADIVSDIGAQGRPQEQKMGYMLNANVSHSTSPSTSEILFTISKPPAGCTEMCWARWKINNGLESNAWQITNDCAQQCGMRKIGPTDVSCDGGMNKFQQTDDGNVKKRGGYCWWRMPFEPANDDPPPLVPAMDRNSKWTVRIHQEMQYEDSSVEWWLIDKNGNEAGHGKATEHARVKGSWLGRVTIEDQGREGDPANQMPYKVTMMVSEPTNKDKSRVWFQMPHKASYTGCGETSEQCKAYIVTETDDETSPMYFRDCSKYCNNKPLVTVDDVGCQAMPGAFKQKNAGYERDFECWWHGVWKARDMDALGASVLDDGALAFDGGMNGTWKNATWR